MALVLAFPGAAFAQNTRPNRGGGRGQAPVPPPIPGDAGDPGGILEGLPGLEGASSSPVFREGLAEAKKIWSGDQQKFQTWVSVSGTPPMLQSLELVIKHPRSGERVERKDVLRLTPDQLNGKQPVEWNIAFTQGGQYEFFFRAQGLGQREVVRFPATEPKTFRVDILWQAIAWAAGLTLFAFLIAKLLLGGLFSRIVKNQTKVAPFSLICWLIATTIIWWWFFGVWSVYVLVGAGVLLLAAMIYVFT
jgi:hypothetical protein